jgi:hypothetical protein
MADGRTPTYMLTIPDEFDRTGLDARARMGP